MLYSKKIGNGEEQENKIKTPEIEDKKTLDKERAPKISATSRLTEQYQGSNRTIRRSKGLPNGNPLLILTSFS